jgi:hypothetical protein
MDMRPRLAFLLVTFALLTGCAATITRQATDASPASMPASASSKLVLNVTGSAASVNSGDWAGFKQEWQENFLEQAKIAGVPFEMQDGPPKATGEEGTLLAVYVEDYRFVRPGTRYAVGIMSGNAFIQSKLTFSNLRTGEVLGSKSANTSSSAWQGVFSAMTNKQVEAIAADVLRDIKGAKISK